MKLFITTLLLLVTIIAASAQNQPRVNMPIRHIQFKPLGKDSINLAFTADYDLIEDSCAEITRYAHYNFKNRKFTGHFKDVSKLDTNIVVSEGFYTAEGVKTGAFISNYINGNHRAKGIYNNGNYEGRWETYYDDAKPQLIFEADNNDIKIIDAWNAEGKKIIDNGKGTYIVNLGYLSWKGKIDNGKPDGTWRGFKTDDATQSSIISETFKKRKV